jgi:UDP-N-acetylglucosamine--N-acetylmuramyl-(pentapeptide) pyrophosphoryl-undecaprenol N-acetylglucosamine transferase
MGGFTSAPPVFAGRSFGAVTFLHESNTVPGRANRLLAHFVDQAFVGFPLAASRLWNANVLTTGTPVRPQFEAVNPSACRMSFGLAPGRPVLLVMGGSQGAAGINDLMVRAAAELLGKCPELQILHLTGISEHGKVAAAYSALHINAVIRPFLTEMELALGAATVAVSRAGASTLAEVAAMRLPTVLIPYPAAADNHQFYNAKAFAETGAARLLDQRTTTASQIAEEIVLLLRDEQRTTQMRARLEFLDNPMAADLIARKIIDLMQARGKWPADNGRGISTEPSNFRHSQVIRA